MEIKRLGNRANATKIRLMTVEGFALDSLLFQKLWFQHVWPMLEQEMKTHEVLAAVLQPIILLIQACSIDEYEGYIQPSFR